MFIYYACLFKQGSLFAISQATKGIS
uniref:Uncharacterized protein n=1 Tax=Rhizophora mucronata TaxID=61149 RepID=A0A2P2PPQ7_RHIMU